MLPCTAPTGSPSRWGTSWRCSRSVQRPGQRVLTGGAWYDEPEYALSEASLYPGYTADADAGADRGFRCAKSIRPLPDRTVFE